MFIMYSPVPATIAKSRALKTPMIKGFLLRKFPPPGLSLTELMEERSMTLGPAAGAGVGPLVLDPLLSIDI